MVLRCARFARKSSAITSKKTRLCCRFFLFKSPGGHAISFQIKPWVAFGLPYLLIELFYIGMPVVRTDGRAGGRSVYGHVITKFFRMGSLQNFFLPMVLRCARLARKSSAITSGKPKNPNKKDMSKKFVIVQCTSNNKGATLRQRHIWILNALNILLEQSRHKGS